MTDYLDNVKKSGERAFIAPGYLIDLLWLHKINAKCA